MVLVSVSIVSNASYKTVVTCVDDKKVFLLILAYVSNTSEK